MNCTDDVYERWRRSWVVTKVLTEVLSIVPLYMTLSLPVYVWNKRKRRVKGITSLDGKYANAIDLLCFLSALSTFLRIGLDLELIIGKDTDRKCAVSMGMKNILYIIALTSLYTILWLRQKVFYSCSSLKHLRSKTISFCSWFVLVFFCVGAAFILSMYITTATYMSTDCGCVRHDRAKIMKYVGGLAGTVISQLILLMLVIFPLLNREPVARRLDFSSARKRGTLVKAFVKRATIATVVCIVSDCVSSGLGIAFGKYEVYKLVFEINLIINLLSVVISFPDWQDRVLPCCMRSRMLAGTSKISQTFDLTFKRRTDSLRDSSVTF